MGEEASFAHTPTWVVAAVCLAIVSVSLAAERFLHYLGKSLKHKEQKTLYSALQRLKEERLLGFISFFPSLSQGFIVHICIPEAATHFMLPCKKENPKAAEQGAKFCKQKGYVPLLSLEALYQLHIFIFVLGLVHVVFCATTILLGGAKMKKWKHWETEIHRDIEEKLWKVGYERKVTPLNVVLHRNHQGKFVSERAKGFLMKLAVVSWILLLIVGAKLEHIITRLAQDAAASLSDGTEGSPKIKPSKEHFWFHKPGLVLHLIHFILFQNSFEIGFFFWVLISEGFSSCMMERKAYAISRLVIGVTIEVVCSYITLPLYAIVTHMGGDIKLQAFGSDVHESVQSWATGARRKKTQAAPDERLGSSRATLTRTPPPDLDEIISIDDGGHGHDGRS